MRIIWSLWFAVLLLGSIVYPDRGQAQLVLYDNFNSPAINPDKWYGTESAGDASAPTAETIRKIVNKKLQLSLVFYGETTSDTGGPSGGLQRLRFNDPSSITEIQAKVTVQKAETEACLANATPARARAQIAGTFFNDGTSTGPDDQTGDMQVGMELMQDSTAGRSIRGFINHCTNADCGTFTTIASTNANPFATTWRPGVARTLLLQWDEPGDQFIFTVNPGTGGAETRNLSYSGFTDTDAAVNERRELRVNDDPVNCTAGRRRVTTTAVFDNIMTN
jgi:hypothetical protein